MSQFPLVCKKLELVRSEVHQPHWDPNEGRDAVAHPGVAGVCQQVIHLPHVPWLGAVILCEVVDMGEINCLQDSSSLVDDFFVSGQSNNGFPSKLNGLSLFKHFLHGVGVFRHHIFLDVLRLYGSWPEGHHGDSSLLEFMATVRSHPVTASLAYREDVISWLCGSHQCHRPH